MLMQQSRLKELILQLATKKLVGPGGLPLPSLPPQPRGSRLAGRLAGRLGMTASWGHAGIISCVPLITFWLAILFLGT